MGLWTNLQTNQHWLTIVFNQVVNRILFKRKFQVKVNSSVSKPYTTETVVPQGSILSPTLLSIFLNDIQISNHFIYQSCLFDDSCTLFYSKSLNETKKQL